MNVTEQQALAQFQSAASRNLLRRARWGPLRSLAEVFVPFHCYTVSIQNGFERKSRLIAVDAVEGTLDPYGFAETPDGADFSPVETRNALPPALGIDRTREIALDKARRELYGAGFFRLRKLCVEAERTPTEFYVPYWIGFYGRGTAAHFLVMDAVRRRMEGAKARELFEDWLLSPVRKCRGELLTCPDHFPHPDLLK